MGEHSTQCSDALTFELGMIVTLVAVVPAEGVYQVLADRQSTI